MTSLFEQLNNREIATLFWLAVFLVFLMAKPTLRKAFGAVLKAFFHPSLLRVFGLALAYIAALVWFLSWRGIWTPDYVYSTTAWTVSFALVAMFEANKMASDKSHISKILRDVLNFTAILIFIIEMQSFDLWVELIAVPIVTFVVLLHEVSKTSDEYALVEKLFGWLVTLIGYGYLLVSLWLTIEQWQQLDMVETIRSFLIPILLSLLFLPFLYALGVYMTYERIFSSMFLWFDDARLRRFAKRNAIVNCRSDLAFLEKWHRHIQRERPKTRDEVRESFNHVSSILRREKNPPEVSPADGWSPWEAKEFMREFGLETRDYRETMDDEWFAESSLKQLGTGYPRNNLAYYVEGGATCAKRLKLRLNVNNPDDDAQDRALFSQAALHLLENASGGCANAQLLRDIEAIRVFNRKVSHQQVSLAREDWSGGIEGGYDLVFAIGV